MKAEEFRTDGVCCRSVWECIEVMVVTEDFVRYRVNGKISRPCKIYSTIKDNRPYFNYQNSRIHLDECMRPL